MAWVIFLFFLTVNFRLEWLENNLVSTHINHRYMSREEFVFINLEPKNASQKYPHLEHMLKIEEIIGSIYLLN